MARTSAANRTREAKRPETTNLIEWIKNNPEKTARDIGLPPHGDPVERRAYEAVWQFKLFPRVVFEILKLKSNALIRDVRERAKHKNIFAQWFASIGDLLRVEPRHLSGIVQHLAASKNLTVKEYIETTNPEDAVEHYNITIQPPPQ